MLNESESIAAGFVFVTSQTNVALVPGKACCGVFDPGSPLGKDSVPETKVASESIVQPAFDAGEVQPAAPVDCAQSSTQIVTPAGMPLITACSIVPVLAGPAVPVSTISSPLSVL
jgi:hypothetical protein